MEDRRDADLPRGVNKNCTSLFVHEPDVLEHALPNWELSLTRAQETTPGPRLMKNTSASALACINNTGIKQSEPRHADALSGNENGIAQSDLAGLDCHIETNINARIREAYERKETSQPNPTPTPKTKQLESLTRQPLPRPLANLKVPCAPPQHVHRRRLPLPRDAHSGHSGKPWPRHSAQCLAYPCITKH